MIYLRQVDDFSEMTDLGKTVRSWLDAHYVVERLEVADVKVSRDGSRKFLFRLKDGHHVETVLIPEKDHYTLCISSQVGCAMDCKFCMTATAGSRAISRQGKSLPRSGIPAHFSIGNHPERAAGCPTSYSWGWGNRWRTTRT